MSGIDRRSFVRGAAGAAASLYAAVSATPNIDALAGQGMRFTGAFTATAMCAPMRQQL
ncbi:MAG: sulfatase-like hydrolase/transferase, partial [bacterium]|nr:sulfatase-like hydrolase/transferase [bacterium]